MKKFHSSSSFYGTIPGLKGTLPNRSDPNTGTDSTVPARKKTTAVFEKASAPLLMSKKKRRRSSESKQFEGDYIGTLAQEGLTKLLHKNGDHEVLFADIVAKINKRSKMQERVLMITENAIYNIDPSNQKLRRRIPIRKLGSLSLSPYADNFMSFHVPTEYDYLISSCRKTEILVTLMMRYELAAGRTLKVQFQRSFDYKAEASGSTRVTVSFQETKDGVVTSLTTSKDAKKR